MSVTLPLSMNLAESKPACVADCKASFQRFRSDNATYGQGDIVRIEIPCGRNGTYLHAQDSFLEFKFMATFTDGANGTTCLDGNCLSIFKSCRIMHGSNVLVNIQNCNRLWHALYDVQCNDRNTGQITMGIITESTNSPHCNLFGAQLTSGNVYPFAFTLPVSLLGSLQEKALPIGMMNASNLYLELEIDTMSRIFTGRQDNNVIGGIISPATGAPTYTSITLSDIYYNAKISLLGAEYDNLLRSALGQNILIPATEYRGEAKAIATGSSSFNDKFSFNMSSAKFFLWWLTTQDTANGVISTYAYNQAITQRQCGPCKEFYLTFNGEMFPSQPISMSLNGLTYLTNKQFGAVAYQHLLRCFNQNSDTHVGSVIDVALYADNRTTIASDGATSKRFVGGIDLDRVDGNNSRAMSGLNTMNQAVGFNVTWDSALSTNQNLYAFVCYDVAYQLQDGLLNVRM
jgi:hypothetical protein